MTALRPRTTTTTCHVLWSDAPIDSPGLSLLARLRPSTSSSSLLTQSGAVEGAPPNRRGAPRRADGSFVPTAFRGLPAAQSGRFVLDPIWKDGGGWAARQRVGALSHVPGVSTCIRRSADRWLRALPSRWTGHASACSYGELGRENATPKLQRTKTSKLFTEPPLFVCVCVCA